MTKRYSLSNSFSLSLRKYVLGPLLLIIAAFLFTRSFGFFTLMGVLLGAIGVFCMLLRTLEYTDYARGVSLFTEIGIKFSYQIGKTKLAKQN